MTRFAFNAFVLAATVAWLLIPSFETARAQQRDPNAVYRVPLSGHEPQKGVDDALVTIVEFGDFEDPFSARVAPTLDQVLQKYSRYVRIVWMNNPLRSHPHAMLAAVAALEAYAQKGSDGFWAMHDKLFANQRGLDRAKLEGLAQQLGLDMTRFKKALDEKKHESTIQRQQQLATALGAGGTPNFFINGRNNVVGARPLETFAAAVDEELAKARKLVAGGTPRSQVYSVTIAKGHSRAVASSSSPEGDGAGVGRDAPAHGRQPSSDIQSRPPGATSPRVEPNSESTSKPAAQSLARVKDDGRYDRQKRRAKENGIALSVFGIALYEPLSLPPCPEGFDRNWFLQNHLPGAKELLGSVERAPKTCVDAMPVGSLGSVFQFLFDQRRGQDPLPGKEVAIILAQSACPSWLPANCAVFVWLVEGYVLAVSARTDLRAPYEDVIRSLVKKYGREFNKSQETWTCKNEYGIPVSVTNDLYWQLDDLQVRYEPRDSTCSSGKITVGTPEFLKLREGTRRPEPGI